MSDAPPDALDAVRAHLDDAHAAADRLVRDAQRRADDAAATGPEEVPPRGWAAPSDSTPSDEVRMLLALLDVVRRAVPPEVSRPMAEALRDLLRVLRTLIDHYLELLEAPAGGEVAAEAEAAGDPDAPPR